MESCPAEFKKPFIICFDLLERAFIYYDDSKSVSCSGVLLIFCAFLFFISVATYLKNIFGDSIDFTELGFSLSIFVVIVQSTFKALIVVTKKSEIKHIIARLGELWKTDNLSETQIKRKEAALKQLTKFHNVFYWVNMIGSWEYILVPIFEVLFRRFILQEKPELLLPFYCSFPFEPTSSWIPYLAAYVFEIVSMIRVVYLYLGAEFLLITLCALLSIEFIILQEDLRVIDPSISSQNGNFGTPEKDSVKKLKDVIKTHQKLLKISLHLDDIFNKMIFVNLLFPTITICLFGFVVTQSRGPADVVNNMVAVLALIVPIFNLCYYGEKLTRASLGISDAAYESLWYKGDNNYQKMLLFIIKRSQRPCNLTSWRYATVTLASFTTVMSTTWSYFSLMRSFVDNE